MYLQTNRRPAQHITVSVFVHKPFGAWMETRSVRVRAFSHLVSLASSSSARISGLWRRCRPGCRCTAPASYRGFSAAGERSVGGRVAPWPAASGGSTRWRWQLPCLRRNRRQGTVSVRASGLFSVHRRGPERRQNSDTEPPPSPPPHPKVSALPTITAPYFGSNTVKSRINTREVTASCLLTTLQAIGLRSAAGYLSVTSHRSVCQSTAVTERLLQREIPGARVSVRVAMVDRRHE